MSAIAGGARTVPGRRAVVGVTPAPARPVFVPRAASSGHAAAAGPFLAPADAAGDLGETRPRPLEHLRVTQRRREIGVGQ